MNSHGEEDRDDDAELDREIDEPREESAPQPRKRVGKFDTLRSPYVDIAVHA